LADGLAGGLASTLGLLLLGRVSIVAGVPVRGPWLLLVEADAELLFQVGQPNWDRRSEAVPSGLRPLEVVGLFEDALLSLRSCSCEGLLSLRSLGRRRTFAGLLPSLGLTKAGLKTHFLP